MAFKAFQRCVQNAEYHCHGKLYTSAMGLFYVFRRNGRLYALDDSKESNDENIFEMTYEKFLDMEPVSVELVHENDVPACQFFNMANRVIQIWRKINNISPIDSEHQRAEGEECVR